MSELFSPLRLREVTFRNRIFMSPMCQYSAIDGSPNSWHLVHLGARAIGGAGLIMVEATAVQPRGRITPADTGIWNDVQTDAFRPIVDFIHRQGSVAGIQLAHAGRKASTPTPWQKTRQLPADQAWLTLAPSAIPFSDQDSTPMEMKAHDMQTVCDDFALAARRARAAGFQVIELHMAHGYLLHEFLSPLSNRRTDEFGGSLTNRMRWPLQVTEAVRKEWPLSLPLFVRVSATDWAPGGWDLEQTLQLARALKSLGVDLLDCSSGGIIPNVKIPVGPGYQVSFATEVREKTGLASGAVGLIQEPEQAEAIVRDRQADAVFVGRELLRDPHWPLRAARELGVDAPWPKPYERAKL